MKKHTIYLASPASEWELATPIGCGKMGAMLYGRTDRELIQLTEESIWSGEPRERELPGFREKIDETRRLFLEGKPIEADAYAKRELEADCGRIKSHETAGVVFIDFGHSAQIVDYRRELDLVNGISTVSYIRRKQPITVESFASYPDNVIVRKIEGNHSFTLGYERRDTEVEIYYRDNHSSAKTEGADTRVGIDSVEVIGDTLIAKGHPQYKGQPFEVRVKLVTDGETQTRGETIFVANATKTELYIVIGVDREPTFPTELDYDKLRERHVADVSQLMSRAEVSFAESDPKLAEMPLEERFARLRADENATDPGLIALYFDFGRYLLVASSRPGSLPANLQGVWNPYINAPWNCDYHLNINLQMNYWHAESANLTECATPLFDFLNNYLLEPGRRTAREHYKCRGTVIHHITDIYGHTDASDGMIWGFWQIGGAWLAYSMWEHYLYTRDEKFLREVAYEFIRDCARFFLDFMFEDSNGILHSGPTTSPENCYRIDGRNVNMCISPTMDIEVIGGLYKFYIETEKLLNLDPEQRKECERALTKLPPLKISSDGRLQEWQEDYEEPEPGHRHISHLFALYPDCGISKETPELFAAAKKSLERRLANGGGHTGWSCAWLIGLFARLGEGEECAKTFRKLLCESTRENLLDSHPPFQIDGNFGATAATVEMLLQSHESVIELLPALPKELASGEFRGLRARGGYTLSARWKDGELDGFEITSDFHSEVTVVCKGREWTFGLRPGETARA